MIYLLTGMFFFAVMLAYFRIADRYNIIDRPNERSSHATVTIRGGGIIFIIAALVGLAWHFKEFWLPALAIAIIGIISFLDDLFTLSNRIRIFFQLASVTVMFIFFNSFQLLPLWGTLFLYVLVIGIVNVYNFMDGINGISGLYSIVVLAGLQWINIRQLQFINPDLIWLPILACAVFLFFNFRKKAKCFAGDAGSVTIAFWIVFLLLRLILETNNWVYMLFLAVYGVDSVLTIIHRLLLKQNIFKAHRFHFYQLLANEKRVPHLLISIGYALVQLAIILFIIFSIELSFTEVFVISTLPLILTYLLVKPRLMKL